MRSRTTKYDHAFNRNTGNIDLEVEKGIRSVETIATKLGLKVKQVRLHVRHLVTQHGVTGFSLPKARRRSKSKSAKKSDDKVESQSWSDGFIPTKEIKLKHIFSVIYAEMIPHNRLTGESLPRSLQNLIDLKADQQNKNRGRSYHYHTFGGIGRERREAVRELKTALKFLTVDHFATITHDADRIRKKRRNGAKPVPRGTFNGKALKSTVKDTKLSEVLYRVVQRKSVGSTVFGKELVMAPVKGDDTGSRFKFQAGTLKGHVDAEIQRSVSDQCPRIGTVYRKSVKLSIKSSYYS